VRQRKHFFLALIPLLEALSNSGGGSVRSVMRQRYFFGIAQAQYLGVSDTNNRSCSQEDQQSGVGQPRTTHIKWIQARRPRRKPQLPLRFSEEVSSVWSINAGHGQHDLDADHLIQHRIEPRCLLWIIPQKIYSMMSFFAQLPHGIQCIFWIPHVTEGLAKRLKHLIKSHNR